jgi:hypothetical protein
MLFSKFSKKLRKFERFVNKCNLVDGWRVSPLNAKAFFRDGLGRLSLPRLAAAGRRGC